MAGAPNWLTNLLSKPIPSVSKLNANAYPSKPAKLHSCLTVFDAITIWCRSLAKFFRIYAGNFCEISTHLLIHCVHIIIVFVTSISLEYLNLIVEQIRQTLDENFEDVEEHIGTVTNFWKLRSREDYGICGSR